MQHVAVQLPQLPLWPVRELSQLLQDRLSEPVEHLPLWHEPLLPLEVQRPQQQAQLPVRDDLQPPSWVSQRVARLVRPPDRRLSHLRPLERSSVRPLEPLMPQELAPHRRPPPEPQEPEFQPQDPLAEPPEAQEPQETLPQQ